MVQHLSASMNSVRASDILGIATAHSSSRAVHVPVHIVLPARVPQAGMLNGPIFYITNLCAMRLV